MRDTLECISLLRQSVTVVGELDLIGLLDEVFVERVIIAAALQRHEPVLALTEDLEATLNHLSEDVVRVHPETTEIGGEGWAFLVHRDGDAVDVSICHGLLANMLIAEGKLNVPHLDVERKYQVIHNTLKHHDFPTNAPFINEFGAETVMLLFLLRITAFEFEHDCKGLLQV